MRIGSLRVEMGNPGLKEMKMRASKKVEKVQLVLPPPRMLGRLTRLRPPGRPDTHIAKFARWPQPYVRQGDRIRI